MKKHQAAEPSAGHMQDAPGEPGRREPEGELTSPLRKQLHESLALAQAPITLNAAEAEVPANVRFARQVFSRRRLV